MNNHDFGSGVFVGVIATLFVVMIFIIGASFEDEAADRKFDDCVGIANKAISDANATADRADFIKSCYEPISPINQVK